VLLLFLCCPCSAVGLEKLDQYAVLKCPLTTESAMKKIEDNNTLVRMLLLMMVPLVSDNQFVFLLCVTAEVHARAMKKIEDNNTLVRHCCWWWRYSLDQLIMAYYAFSLCVVSEVYANKCEVICAPCWQNMGLAVECSSA
jgi:hypothetical protein